MKYPHNSVKVPGLHAYAERYLYAGDTLHLKCASTIPYHCTIHKLDSPLDKTEKATQLEEIPLCEGKIQDIHPGSYVRIQNSFPAQAKIGTLAIECWVRPWEILHKQAIFSQFDFCSEEGFLLGLLPSGKLHWCLGKQSKTLLQLTRQCWHHLVMNIELDCIKLYCDGQLICDENREQSCYFPKTPLCLGSAQYDGVAGYFLDADLAIPCLYSCPLSPEEVNQRLLDRGTSAPQSSTLLSCWLLKEEIGSTINDSGRSQWHGEIINNGTWMTGGPSFDSLKVPRYESYSPEVDPGRGHGLRLASDDLYDCHWETTETFRVPENATTCIYFARYHYQWKGKEAHYDVTFFVRNKKKGKAPILVVATSNTWAAYNSPSFPESSTLDFYPIHDAPECAEEPPVYSCYVDHKAGQPAYQFGNRVPWPSASPDILFSEKNIGYSQALRLERNFHLWLDREHYHYDIVSDFEVDEDPDLFEGYQTVALVGHSEYWSLGAMQKLDSYLEGGGNLIVLSGNTMFWRVSHDRDTGIMECRKWEYNNEERGSTLWNLSHERPNGELFHSQDKLRGGLLREAGFPAWKLIGLESATWWVDYCNDRFGSYRVTAPDHFLFHQPNPVTLQMGGSLGIGCIGHETDLRLSRLLKSRKVPPTEPPVEPEGIVTLAEGFNKQGAPEPDTQFDYYSRPNSFPENLISEIIYWERPNGGKVFNVGSVGAAWPLLKEEAYSNLLKNVLFNFAIESK